MSSINEMSVSQLSRLIGLPHAPIVIDVRLDADIKEDPYLIPCAIPCKHSEIQSLLPELTSNPVVVACQKELKLSQGAAALLRTEGINATYLTGGTLAWKLSLQPVLAISFLSDLNWVRLSKRQSTLWVSEQLPGAEHLACSWLIRRFIDAHAKFLFVERSEVLNVAEKFSANAFSKNHEPLAFNAILNELKMNVTELQQMAAIIRGEMMENTNLTSVHPGFSFILSGLSTLYRDDTSKVETSLALYDAPYSELRNSVFQNNVTN